MYFSSILLSILNSVVVSGMLASVGKKRSASKSESIFLGGSTDIYRLNFAASSSAPSNPFHELDIENFGHQRNLQKIRKDLRWA